MKCTKVRVVQTKIIIYKIFYIIVSVEMQLFSTLKD